MSNVIAAAIRTAFRIIATYIGGQGITKQCGESADKEIIGPLSFY